MWLHGFTPLTLLSLEIKQQQQQHKSVMQIKHWDLHLSAQWKLLKKLPVNQLFCDYLQCVQGFTIIYDFLDKHIKVFGEIKPAHLIPEEARIYHRM